MNAVRLLLAVSVVLCVSPLAASGQATATGEGAYSAVFRGIPLKDALEEVVGLTDIDLVYDAALLGDHTAYCARRRVSADELLRCVLAGSGLDFVRSSAGTYVLIVSPRRPPRMAQLAGRVVDAETGDPMPYAHVFLADTGTTADLEGQFVFADVLPGRHRIVATFVGYEASMIDSVWVEPGSRGRVTVALRPSEHALAPIVVDGLTQRLPSASLGRVEAATAASAMIAATPDVMRGAAATVGVSSALPLADLHIQGGNTTEHVTRLDGVPVRDPVSLGRYLGAFSPLAIRDVTVHKAGFSAARGSLIAGAIDIRHDVNAVARGGALQIDPVSVNARLSAPLTGVADGGAIMLAYRQSTFGVYRDPGISELLRRANVVDPLITSGWLRQPLAAGDIVTTSQVPDLAFSDAHAAIRLRLDPYSSIHASLFRAGNFVAADHSVTVPYGGTGYGVNLRDVYDWTNWAGQVQYSTLLGARSTLMVRARGSHHYSSYVYDYGIDATPSDDGGPPMRDPPAPHVSDSRHRLVEAGADAQVTYSLAPGRDVEAGLSADYVSANFHGANAWVTPFAVTPREAIVAGFIQSRLTFGTNVTLEGGTRVTALPSTGRFYAEPRMSLRYDGQLAGIDGYALKVSGGVYRQFVNGFAFTSGGPAALVPELWFWLPAGDGIRPPLAVHSALEGLLLPARGWSVRAEIYHRHEPHLLALDTWSLVTEDHADASPAGVITPVRGRALGAGAGIEWSGTRGSMGLTYSFERSRRSTSWRDELLAVPWEEPNRLSLDARARLGRGFGLEAAGRGIWGRSWGLRQAYYDYIAAGQAPVGVPDLTRPEEHRLPPLLILDAKATYARSLGGTNLSLELGLANVFDRENVVDWSAGGALSESGRVARSLPGRRLTFGVRIGF